MIWHVQGTSYALMSGGMSGSFLDGHNDGIEGHYYTLVRYRRMRESNMGSDQSEAGVHKHVR
jgi:hypothetical protein